MLLSAQSVGYISDLARTALIARTLGAGQFGVLTLVLAAVRMANQFVDFRVWETTIKYLSEFLAKDDRARALAIVKGSYVLDFLTGVLAFGIAYLLAPVAARYIIKEPTSDGLVRLYAFVLLIATTEGTSSAILRVFGRFRWLSGYRIVLSLGQLILVWIALSFEHTPRVVLLGYLFAHLLAAGIVTWFALRVIREQMGGSISQARLSVLQDRTREIVGLLFQTNLTTFLRISITSLDEILLGYFWNPVAVGQYRLAKNLVQPLGKLNAPMYEVVYPEVINLWGTVERRSFNRYINRVTLVMGSILVPVALGICVLAPWLLKLFGGPEYLSASTALRVMVICEAIQLSPVWVRPAAVSMGKVRVMNIALVISAVLWAVGAIFFVRLGGMTGTGILHGLNGLVRVGFIWFLLKKVIRRRKPMPALAV